MPAAAARAQGYTPAADCAKLAALTAAPPVTAREPEPDDGTIRVLFIGNSLTFYNELPWMVETLARSRGVRIKTVFEGFSGADLKQQWERGRALQQIREHRWTWVVLQDRSTAGTLEPDELREYARRFDAEIRARGAKTMLFLTWTHRNDPRGQVAITGAYRRAGAELHAAVAPVGVLWERLLPRIQLFDDSGVHPNVTGTYLAACVFVAMLTGQNPNGLQHRFDAHYAIAEAYRQSLEHDTIDANDAEAIQRAAWEAVHAHG
jgi:hypothetical protein